ncbi:MAG: S-methyl-5-thioribose-1-phosphate isomerase [Betaproteobacteria bacterium RIFCSPLOWO2_12_FULL_64_23]|nr:MAG: S-methyl-5-thioribose-1-phosphate isomerase [Betaproteobacteria bacterium RIFCSPLOWO2_12_FULL_64_23]
MQVETLRWREGRLELIDQRRLPLEFEYVACTDAAQVARAIRDMVVRGAPAIGCSAAYGVALEARRHAGAARAQFDVALDQAFRVLAQSRPTAVNLFWALERMRQCHARTRGGPVQAAAEALLQLAQQIHSDDIEINRAIGRHGAPLIAEGARVMTHCNAGALATAGHGTALGVIRSARDAGKHISVIANETRPYLQGARLTAWEMVQESIPVTLVTDNMAGHLMQQGRVDVIVVGADRVAANGDTANKIGTYTLAVLAERHRIPFYVAAPLSTIDMAIADGSAIPIEERDPAEVTGFRGVRWAAEGVNVANPAFDVTPAALITGLITESGVVGQPDAGKIRALFER